MNFIFSWREKHLFVYFLLTVISLIIYSNSLHNGFVYDDYYTILSSVFIKSPKYLPKIITKDYFILSEEQTYRPIVTITYFLEYSLWKLNHFGYHFTNLILHIFNSQLTYYFTFLITENFPISIFASLLFATHPVQTEVVNGISFREDLLVFLFFTLSLIFYLKNKFFLSYVFFFLSLFSKENSITLPLIIFLYIFIFKNNFKEEILKNKFYYTGYFGILIFYLLVRFIIMNNPNPEPVSYIDGSFYKTILSEFLIILKYFRFFLYPVNLSIIHEYKIVKSIFDISFIISFFCLILIFIFAIFLTKNKIIKFGIFYFFLNLIPVSNIVPLYNPICERYLYLPSSGIFLIIGDLFNKILLSNKKVTISSFTFLIFFYSILTFNRNFAWENNEKLFLSASYIYPDNWIIQGQLGNEYRKKGLYSKAMEKYQIALKSNKTDILTYINVAVTNYWLKNYKKSIEQFTKLIEFTKSIEKKPRRQLLSFIYYNRGVCYFTIKNYDKAVEDFKKAISINPYFWDAKISLAIVYKNTNRKKEAIKEFKKLIEEAPYYIRSYFAIASIYSEMKDYENAIKYLNLAKKIEPENPEIYFGLAEIYFKKGESKKALQEYKNILKIAPELKNKINGKIKK